MQNLSQELNINMHTRERLQLHCSRLYLLNTGEVGKFMIFLSFLKTIQS